jgi:hypothetical protein
MSMPEDNKGTAPEDVEAHGPRQKRDAQGEQPGRLRDTSQDVDDVEAHRRHFFDTDQAGNDEDVEAHVTRQKRDAEGDEVPRLR